jgi:protein SCO1/2
MKRIRSLVLTTIAAGLALSLGSDSNALHAQQYSADKPMGATAQQLPTYPQHAGIEQRLNQSLRLSASFTDESNISAPLSHWIGRRPTVLCARLLQMHNDVPRGAPRSRGGSEADGYDPRKGL